MFDFLWTRPVVVRRSERHMKTKREFERDISQAIIHFEKEFMGRGPLETKSFIVDDMVLVRIACHCSGGIQSAES